MNANHQQRLISNLQNPRCYPHYVKSVRLVETHISWVLLAGRYAYKIKKALNLGFLDFTSLAGRRFYCEEEIRLNRRLAPQLYLDVVPIGGSPDNPKIGAQPAIECAVRMRRFAASKLMDRQLTRGLVTSQHMDSLAQTLVLFHRDLPAAPAHTAYGDPSAIRAAERQNFEQLHTLLPNSDQTQLTELSQAFSTEYSVCKNLMAWRRAQGYVRECHGDLHLGNLVLLDGKPVAFDGIEFNPEFRWIDVMSEVAFPVMDLLYRDQSALAFHLLNAYLEGTGDYAGLAVLRFYLAYRATVRAKIGAIRAGQPNLSKRIRQTELSECRRHLVLAQKILSQKNPALIITHGLPGSGKSTFAQMALQRLPCIRIRSDVERKRLFGLGALDNSHASGVDIYSHAATQQTYMHLLELAQLVLAAGFTVIVDAAFLKREERGLFHKLAQDRAIPFVIVTVAANDATLQVRVAQRGSSLQDASEADIAILKTLQGLQQPLGADEIAYAVEFINNGDKSSLAHAPGWDKLQRLVAGQQ